MYCSSWVPDREVLNHSGLPIMHDDDFFVPPPPEIGTIVTAHTNLKEDREPTAFAPRRIRTTLLTGLVFLALGWLCVVADGVPSHALAIWRTTLPIASLAMIVAWLNGRPHYSCSYGGTRGIARFSCYGKRTRITRREIFCFEKAECLKVAERRLYVNGAYLNTWYSMRWYDRSGRICYRISGIHHNQNDKPPPDDPYVLARAAEWLWSMHLWPKVRSVIERGETYRFMAGRGTHVDVSADCIQLRGQRFDYEELNLQVERGLLLFRRKDDRKGWYRLDRALRVKCAELENALVLIGLIEDKGGNAPRLASTASEGRYLVLPHSIR